MASQTTSSTPLWPAPSALTSFIAANLPPAMTNPEAASPDVGTTAHDDAAAQSDARALHALALQVQHNLTHQHDWTDVQLHTTASSLRDALLSTSPPAAAPDLLNPQSLQSSLNSQNSQDLNSQISTPSTPSTNDILARPLLTGTPPRHLYLHPDVQVALIRARLPDAALRVERAVVCPAHLREGGWSLRRLAGVFAGIPGEELFQEREGALRMALGLKRENETQEGEMAEREDRGREGDVIEDPEATVKAKVKLPNDGKKRVLLGIVDSDSTVVYYWCHDGIVKPRQN